MKNVSELLKKFINELELRIVGLEINLEELTKKSDAISYLRHCKEYNVADSKSIMRLDANKICELYSIFEPGTNLDVKSLENAITICKMVDSQPSFRSKQRYIESAAFLKKIFMVFNSKVMGKTDSIAILGYQKEIARLTDLLSFINGDILDFELKELDKYRFSNANFSEEEWNEIYRELLLLQIEQFKISEEKELSGIKEQIEEKIEFNANLVEQAIEDELSSIIGEIKTDESVQTVETIEVVPQTEKPIKVSSEKELCKYELNPELVQSVEGIKLKFKEYYHFKFSAVKEKEMSGYFNNGQLTVSLEDIQKSCSPSDFKSFLYYCATQMYSDVEDCYNIKCTEEEISDYVVILSDAIDNTNVYLNRLERLVLAERAELEQESLISHKSEKTINKIIFYKYGERAEIEKNVKGFTKESIKELLMLINKLECGHLENAFSIRKDIPVYFNAIRSTSLNILYKVLPDNHILVFGSFELSEVNKPGFYRNISITNSDVEEYVSATRDKDAKYRTYIKDSEETKHRLIELDKGVGLGG